MIYWRSYGWRRVAADLKSFGYDGTVTLEVFAGERTYRQDSAERWRSWWERQT